MCVFRYFRDIENDPFDYMNELRSPAGEVPSFLLGDEMLIGFISQYKERNRSCSEPSRFLQKSSKKPKKNLTPFERKNQMEKENEFFVVASFHY